MSPGASATTIWPVRDPSFSVQRIPPLRLPHPESRFLHTVPGILALLCLCDLQLHLSFGDRKFCSLAAEVRNGRAVSDIGLSISVISAAYNRPKPSPTVGRSRLDANRLSSS